MLEDDLESLNAPLTEAETWDEATTFVLAPDLCGAPKSAAPERGEGAA